MTAESIRVQKTLPQARVPERQSAGAAGYDLYSTEAGSIPPKGRRSIRTGLKWSIPHSTMGIVFGRSGFAAKNWIEVVESYVHPGVFEELVITLVNNGNSVFEFEECSRIAQIVFVETAGCDISLVDSLDSTERGSLGFGSTGTK